MPTVKMYDMAGNVKGDVELNEAVFGCEVNSAVLHSVIRAYLLNQRQGTQSTKTRSEVSGGGKKPWRQKGTGRARQGSTRAPFLFFFSGNQQSLQFFKSGASLETGPCCQEIGPLPGVWSSCPCAPGLCVWTSCSLAGLHMVQHWGLRGHR